MAQTRFGRIVAVTGTLMALGTSPALAEGLGDVTQAIAISVIGVAVVVGIFLLCREALCWYWKINLRLTLMEEIAVDLKRLAEALESRTATEPASGDRDVEGK